MDGKQFQAAIAIARAVSKEPVEISSAGPTIEIYARNLFVGEVSIQIPDEGGGFPVDLRKVEPGKLAHLPRAEKISINSTGDRELVFMIGSRRISFSSPEKPVPIERIPFSDAAEETTPGMADPHALKAALEHVIPAASTEKRRHNLMGVCFDPTGVLIGTDGHRMHGAPFAPINSERATLSLEGAQIVARTLRHFKRPGTVIYKRCDGMLAFSFQEDGMIVHLTLATLESPFPDWERVLPGTDKRTTISLDKKEIEEAVRLAEKFTDAVTIQLDEGVIHLSGGGFSETLVPIHQPSVGGGKRVALNPRYLLDAMRTLPGDTANLDFGDDAGPVMLRPAAEGAWSVVMPTRA